MLHRLGVGDADVVGRFFSPANSSTQEYERAGNWLLGISLGFGLVCWSLCLWHGLWWLWRCCCRHRRYKDFVDEGELEEI
mmetsp:Transcript_50954/g.164438  ORF Transcript_50954/g.164438 Transcript_50954/m.164438 type:complete len:80 (+) Transcript_50954:210-449(+)